MVAKKDRQGEFFEPEQIGFDLGDEPETAPASTHDVRLKLNAILATAKAARDRAPWDRETHRHHQAVFPQLAEWLPPDEAEFLRRQFVLELERIERLIAA